MKLSSKQWAGSVSTMKFGVGLSLPDRGKTPGEGAFVPTEESWEKFRDAIFEAGAVEVADAGGVCAVMGVMFDIESLDEIPKLLKTVTEIAGRTLVLE